MIQRFGVSVKGFAALADDRATKVLQAFLFTTCRAIVTKEGRWGPGTPVRTGFAAGSWRVAIGEPPNGPSNPSVDAISAPTDFADLLAVAPGDIVYLASACVYMPELESGWSQQAPTGMVEIVIMQAQAIMDEAVAQTGGSVG